MGNNMISTYTICFNPLLEYYPIKEMILSNLQFADEVVIADFGSTDGTLELLSSIISDITKNPDKYYGKLKIIKGDTKYENTEYFYTEAKNQALDATSNDNDWVIRTDADEIIPEWYFKNIIELGKITDKKIYAFRFKRLHFYKDYNTIKSIPKDKLGYTYMFRKSTTARHKYVVGNCDGLIRQDNNTFFDDLGETTDITVFHYSWCRPIKIMLKKIQRIEKKLIPFNELRKKYFPNEYKIGVVNNDWTKIDSSFSNEEIENKVFDISDTVHYNGKHPLLMDTKINSLTYLTNYLQSLTTQDKIIDYKHNLREFDIENVLRHHCFMPNEKWLDTGSYHTYWSLYVASMLSKVNGNIKITDNFYWENRSYVKSENLLSSKDWISYMNNLSIKNNLPLITEHADMEKLQYQTNFFDVVSCISTIEHVKNDKLALEELYRVLKPNGILYLTTEFNLTTEKEYSESDNSFFRIYNTKIFNILKDCGFGVEIYNIDKNKNKKSKQFIDFSTLFIKAIKRNKEITNKNENLSNNITDIKISACILTRNEPSLIKDTILNVYKYVDEIIVNDGSDNDSTEKEIYTLHTPIIKYFKTNATTNFAEERNKMHNWATGDYVLHIDTDERFNVRFLESIKNIVEKLINNNELSTLPILFRFPRKGDNNDINKYPDYQIRLLNRKYSKWIRSVHEIPTIIRQDKYLFNNKEFRIRNLITLNEFPITHLPKNRVEERKRWDILENKDDLFKQRKLLICTMFKNSEKWLNNTLQYIENSYYYNENCDEGKLKIRIAFLDGISDDNTSKIIKNYITSTPIPDIWYKYYEYIESNASKVSRYNKLANLRNYLIAKSIKDIYNNKLNDNDLILFMDSDIKFDSNAIHELIIDMNKCNADIIAPLVCIENYGVFKNNYFYDTLAFRNKDNENFSHFKPYTCGEIKKSTINKTKDEKIKDTMKKIDELNELRRINWEFNNHFPLNPTLPENLYKKTFDSMDLNIPIQVNSVGSFYIMKYKVVKNVKYTGNTTSEQVEFMNSARSMHYKIFVSQRLKVLHVNLEKYGLRWH